MPMPLKHAAGDRYGRLTNIGQYAEKRKKHWFHKMLCDCGTVVVVAGGELTRGRVRSCGCLRHETITTHGMTHSPEYAVWACMIQRCSNPNDAAYPNYGGRGIEVCDRWKTFAHFIDNMGVRPTSKHTLERIDNDKGYSPQNCTWASRTAQSRNQRTRKDNSTGVRGVAVRGDKYIAYISAGGSRKFLGTFAILADASTARLKAETLYFSTEDA